MNSNDFFIDEINKLRKIKNAVILAHYYQIPEIQDIADFIGDSLALSQQAESTNADIIVFAGVHFMAETAKIINPRKKVLIPDMNAGCSLADSCPYDAFENFIKQHPDHKVISYINCSARVKTISDIICTSGNAVKIVNSFPKEQQLIFAPDKNLGSYVNNITGRNMVLWNGTCEVHDMLSVERILLLKKKNKNAKIIAHPECKQVILEVADFVGSTTALLNFTKSDVAEKYIVATETGIIHQMKKSSPDKEFIIATSNDNCFCNDCPYMKYNSLEKIYFSLLNEKPEIILEEDILIKAKLPIFRMLDVSK